MNDVIPVAEQGWSANSASTSNRFVTIAVVVAFNGDQWLERCVDFLRHNSEGDVQIVIGDNYGNSLVSSVVDGRNVASVELPGPLGFAEANNQVLVKIGFESRFICFLNQDTRSPSGWLTAVSRFLDEHPDIGAVTPLISTYDGDDWDPNFVACTKPLEGFFRQIDGQGNTPRFFDVPVIPAPAMVVRTSLLKQIGGFDPIYGSYYEDYDLCSRIRQAGYRVGIWTGATVAHYSGSATATREAEDRRQRLIVRNRLIYRVRTAPDGRGRQLAREFFLELPRQFARRLLGRPAAKPIRTLVGGYSDAIRVLPRLVFAEHDRRRWRDYLESLGWPAET